MFEGDLSDITLVYEDYQQIQVHKVILSCVCEAIKKTVSSKACDLSESQVMKKRWNQLQRFKK